MIGKRRLWRFSLHLTAKKGSTRESETLHHPNLPPGRYLAKIFIDTAGKLERAPLAELGAEELVGEVEFDARWQAGMRNAVEIHFPGDDAEGNARLSPSAVGHP